MPVTELHKMMRQPDPPVRLFGWCHQCPAHCSPSLAHLNTRNHLAPALDNAVSLTTARRVCELRGLPMLKPDGRRSRKFADPEPSAVGPKEVPTRPPACPACDRRTRRDRGVGQTSKRAATSSTLSCCAAHGIGRLGTSATRRLRLSTNPTLNALYRSTTLKECASRNTRLPSSR